jgi:hypothetical protein
MKRRHNSWFAIKLDDQTMEAAALPPRSTRPWRRGQGARRPTDAFAWRVASIGYLKRDGVIRGGPLGKLFDAVRERRGRSGFCRTLRGLPGIRPLIKKA